MDLDERDCAELEDLLTRQLGDLRVDLYTTSLPDEEERKLEQRELRLERLRERVARRRPAWRAECASLDGLVGPRRFW